MENSGDIKPILLKFAPAWKRIAAYMIDMLLLSALLFFLVYQAFSGQIQNIQDNPIALSQLVAPDQPSNPQVEKMFPSWAKTYIVLIINNQPLTGIASMVLFAAYFILFWAASGQTLGNKIFRIAVIDIKSSPISIMQALMRCSILLLSQLVWYLPLLFVLQPVYKQRIHDLFSNTVVIEIPDNLKEQIVKQKELQKQQIMNEQDSVD